MSETRPFIRQEELEGKKSEKKGRQKRICRMPYVVPRTPEAFPIFGSFYQHP
jgi:hypothetical protein